ncbi:hypothetical protein [Stakelama tenebrarum]|nr:hypothetical protein [Sphingosinithalassobacter tenebrarum]
MRGPIALPILFLVAACSQQPASEENAVPANGMDSVAAVAAAGVTGNAGGEVPGVPAQTGSDAYAAGAEAAVDVLVRYFAAIGQGDYSAAWQLWDDRGARSGMSVEEFGAGFAKYRSYSAEIGTPGRIDAGAGNRYVTIPVVVTGTLKDADRPFRLQGPVTLHRNAEIPGTTEEDRSWRIWSSDLDAHPAREETEAVAEILGNESVAE